MMVKLDPVTLEVIRNALPAVANEMAADLQRTSYNMMIYEVRDFCTALTDAEGRLISQNVGGVSHFVADIGVVIEDGVAKYGRDGFSPDDVIITNHQRVAGQHLNNIVIYMPFIYEGDLLGFAVTRAHWIDVGGMSTGFGAGPTVTDPWLEGLQIDQLRIYEGGRLNETLHQIIKDNIRYPESSLGDLRSQAAACKLAIRRMQELMDRYGRETVLASIDTIFRETEQKCRNVVSTIADGVYAAESVYDDDSVDIDQPIEIKVKVTVEKGHMTIDLSGCSTERRGAVNARTLAGARVAYKALTAPQEPVNEGSFTALDIVIPEGNVMMARYPAPMSSWSLIVPTVVDTIIKALSPAMPHVIPAAHHGLLGGSIVFFGNHPETGKSFIVQSIEGGGWGGRPMEDGESGSVSVCQGDVRNAPIEKIEMQNPVLVESRGFRTDSGGAGKNRGGLGLDVRVQNLVPGKWNLSRPKRVKTPPWGLWGGKPGGGANFLLCLPGENDFKVVDSVMRPVPAETRVIVRTGGGGGWGDPFERAPERVLSDVREGLVTVEAAEREYGVVLDAPGTGIDRARTEELRRKRREGEAA